VISAETLSRIAAQVAELGVSDAALAALRQAWPDVHFTHCSEDDVPARLVPSAQGDGFALYLISNASHCMGFTDHPEAATGIVLAETGAE